MEKADQVITIHPDHILVERPPDYEVEISGQLQALVTLSAVCNQANCKKVLIVGPRTRVELSAFDIVELGKEIAKLDIQLAIAETHDASDDAVSLLESVALSRGCHIRYFDDVEVAKDWLGI